MSGVDRAALIAAAEESIVFAVQHLTGRDARFAANVALDAVLPLIADAIIAAARSDWEPGPRVAYRTAALVRSFGQDGE